MTGTQAPTSVSVQRSTSNQPLALKSQTTACMPADIQTRIFEKFCDQKSWQGNWFGPRNVPRMGDHLGGDLRIEPSAMGGATFVLELPLMELPGQ